MATAPTFSRPPCHLQVVGVSPREERRQRVRVRPRDVFGTLPNPERQRSRCVWVKKIREREEGTDADGRTDGRAHLLTFPCKASRVPTPPERSAASPSSRANRQNRDAATQQPFVNPHLSIQDGIRSHHGMIRLPLIEKFRIQCQASASQNAHDGLDGGKRANLRAGP